MRRKSNKTAYLIIAFCALIVSGLITVAVVSESTPVGSDGCYRDKTKITNAILIFLDSSDVYSATHLATISREIFKKISAAPEGTFISVASFSLNEASPLTSKRMSLCVPTKSIQDSPLFAQLKKQRFEETIEAAVFNDLTSDHSPIIEAIGEVMAEAPIHASNIELIIVSDLMQHSSLLSMYAQDWLKTEALNRQRIEKSRPSLNGVQLDLFFVTRPQEDRQNFAVRDWWLEFLSGSGATVRRFKIVSG